MARRASTRPLLIALAALVVVVGLGLVIAQWFRRPAEASTGGGGKPSTPGGVTSPPATVRPPGPRDYFPPSVSDPAVRARRIDELLAKARAADNPASGGDALAALRQLLRLDPEHAEAKALRQKVLKYYPTDAARTWLGRATAEGPVDSYSIYRLARVQALVGDTDAALRTVTEKKAAIRQPADLRAIGDALVARGEFALAREVFRKASSAAWTSASERASRPNNSGLSPDFAAEGIAQERSDDIYRAAVGLAQAGDLKHSWGELLLGAAHASHRTRERTFLAMVNASVDMGEFADALETGEMIGIGPDARGTLKRRAVETLAAQGDFERARALIATMPKQDYYADAARHDLLRRIAQRDPAAAEREAADIYFRHWRARTYLAIADVHVRAKRSADARRVMDLARSSAATEGIRTADAPAALAGLEARLGDTAAALRTAGAISSPVYRQLAYRRAAAGCLERNDLPAARNCLTLAAQAAIAINKQDEAIGNDEDRYWRFRDAAVRDIIAMQVKAGDRDGAANTANKLGGVIYLAANLARAGDLAAVERILQGTQSPQGRQDICLAVAEALVPPQIVPPPVPSDEIE